MSSFAVCGGLQQIFLTMLLLGTALLQMFLAIEDVAGRRYLCALPDSILLIAELIGAGILCAAGENAADAAAVWLLESGLLLYAVVRYVRTRMRMRYSLSWESVKEGCDNLPDGISFFDEYGTVQLINRKMMAVGMMLSGKDIQTLDELRGALAAPRPGVECLDGTTGLYRFPDKTVRRFTRSWFMDRSGKQITEVIAADVTELYAKQVELNRENACLVEANKRMRWILDNMNDIVREEEILSMKIRIHDDIGHSILAAKKALIEQQDIAVIKENAVLWEKAADLLYRANNMPPAEDEWETVRNRAGDLGVEIVLDGTLPEEEAARHLLILAIRECVTNCVRHAGGDKVFVETEYGVKQTVFEISNNGRAPQHAVAEGSGLFGLRRRVEREGGIMELAVSPRFLLRVTMTERDLIKGVTYEECHDRGRPENDTEHSGRVY